MLSKHLRGKLLSSKIYPDFFPFTKKDEVINIGCGEGPQVIIYSKQYSKMIGIDINKERLRYSEEVIKDLGIDNFKAICSDVESIPLKNKLFDKALAIDIIEHVKKPQDLCYEAHRLLKHDGELLITFPVMYEKYCALIKIAGRIVKFIIGRKKKDKKEEKWNPDDHHHKYPIKEWIRLVEDSGFKLVRSRATTLFPPLFLIGIPRFWFSIKVIYKIDSFFCKLPVLRNLGQTLLCVFKEVD